ncbi:MAG: Jag N-terminal domain-containing protein, partial [Chloroflexi bacterium]|nr:Jag N-terminal domain-containing protein [Chloroflexota bacterium]
MSTERRTLEVRGENVEQAIEAGLAELGLTRADAIVEVLDEGSSGFLGIGGRDAVVRLTMLAESPPEPAVAPVAPEAAQVPGEPGVSEPDEAEAAREVVTTLLEKMHVRATVTVHYSDPDDITGERRPVVNIEGDDLSMLIGPHGETLNAFQFVSRLIAGHALHKRPAFIVDVASYRERREQALARLAERMASKAMQQGRPISLEPMPANERRIIHMTL